MTRHLNINETRKESSDSVRGAKATHAQSRASDRCPDIQFGNMVCAVAAYFDNGYHEQIDLVMDSENGGRILRFHDGDVVAYPIISRITGQIITVYDHDMVTRHKADKKYKKKMRRKKEWREL